MSAAWSRRRLPLVAASALAACRPAPPDAGRPRDLVYVVSASAGTITPLSAETHEPVGPPIPAGLEPRSVVAAPGGHLLVLSVPLSPGPAPRLTLLSRAAQRWTARPVAIPEQIDQPVLSSAGGGHAALLYRRRTHGAGQAAFRIAHLDAERGVVLRVIDPCLPGEHATAVAYSASAGALAHVGIWAGPDTPVAPSSDPSSITSGHRVVTLDLVTRAEVASCAVSGPISWLQEVPSSRRLAAGVSAPGPTPDEAEADVLLVAHPSLAVVSTFRFPVGLFRVALTPDGTEAYGLDPAGEQLFRVDLLAGTQSHVATLPTPASALAAAGDSLFVALPRYDQVAIYDRRTMDRRQTIPVGAHPIGFTLAPQ